MTQYNSRLMNEPRLRRVVELTDDLSQHAQEIADALADYEAAVDLQGQERTDARNDARDEFWSSWESLQVVAAELAKEREAVAVVVERA